MSVFKSADRLSLNNAISRSNTAFTNSNTAITKSKDAITNSNTAITNSNTAITKSKDAITKSNEAFTNADKAMTDVAALRDFTQTRIDEIYIVRNGMSESIKNLQNDIAAIKLSVLVQTCSELGKQEGHIRLYTSEECDAMNGVYNPNGECTKKEGGSFSYDCGMLYKGNNVGSKKVNNSLKNTVKKTTNNSTPANIAQRYGPPEDVSSLFVVPPEAAEAAAAWAGPLTPQMGGPGPSSPQMGGPRPFLPRMGGRRKRTTRGKGGRRGTRRYRK